MENKGEGISSVLQEAREREAEKQRKNPNSVVNFRASLRYDNIRKAFDRMFNPDGSFTDEGQKDWNRFSNFKLKLDSSVTYYVKGSTQMELFKFLCFYIMKERSLRVTNAKRIAERTGKSTIGIADNIFNLMPIVLFASTFIDYKTNSKSDDDLLGDSKSKILVFYIPDTPLYGDQPTFFASQIKDYAHTKNLSNEHVIILAEKSMVEFSGSTNFPVIDLSTGATRAEHRSESSNIERDRDRD